MANVNEQLESSPTWREQTLEERITERRGRLLDAALEVFTTQGFRATKVRDVCREAKLTERYFYESFADKEALLGALTDTIVADLVDASGPSMARINTDLDDAIRSGARAVVSSLTDDPRRARILFVEMVGVSPAIEQRRRDLIGTLAELVGTLADVVADKALPGRDPNAPRTIELELIARALIGSIQELLIAFARNELALDQELLITSIERLFSRARRSFQTTIALETERTAT